MAGNKKSVKKTVATCKRLYGKDFYKVIGAKGGNPMLLQVREDKLRKEVENANT